MEHPDQDEYRKFCGPAMLKRSVNMLLGIVEGIASDSEVSQAEVDLLNEWMQFHRPYEMLHPFTEFFPLISAALADGKLDVSEKDDLLWLAQRVIGGEFEKATKTDMQILHGILQGITADGQLTTNELGALKDWILEHDHLKKIWPYDEIESLVLSALSDGVVTEEEHQTLMSFLSDFCELKQESAGGIIQHSVAGICSMCPEIEIKGSSFCFTGSSSRMTRKEFEKTVNGLGGVLHPRVIRETNYLVIGDLGNPCWAFACYGRKVEHAMKLRKEGSRLQVVHENDFWDAVQDAN